MRGAIHSSSAAGGVSFGLILLGPRRIEDRAMLKAAAEAGFDAVQGFGISLPLQPQEVLDWLRRPHTEL